MPNGSGSAIFQSRQVRRSLLYLRVSYLRLTLCTLFSFFLTEVWIEAQPLMIDTLETKLARATNPIEQGAILLELADAYKQVDLEQVKAYIQKAEAIPEYASRPDKALKIKFMYGALAERQNKFDTAKIIMEQIIASQQQEITDSMVVANCHYHLGNMNRRQGINEPAIQHLNQSIDLHAAMRNDKGVAAAEIVLGIIYKNNGLYDEAIGYYQDAAEVYKKNRDYNNLATCVLNLANVYTRQKKYDHALRNYHEALELGQNLDEKDNISAFVFGNMSNLYSLRKDHEKALDYARRSYDLRKAVATPEEQATSLIGMANNLNHLKRYNEAIEILNKAKQTVATTSGLVQVQERIYEMEYKIYQALDLPDQTLEAISQYLIFHDSLNRTSLKKQALELNTKYETERKEQEIELLNTKNELTLSELKGARRQAIGLAGGLLIFGVMIFFLFRLFRKTRTQNITIKKALDEKELLLREIHHRVKNNLQFISSLLGLQSEHISDVTALSALQEGQDRVQSMALIHQNLYQEDNLTGVEIKDYFVKLIRNLFDSYNIRPGQVHLELDLANLNLDVDTVIPIGLIVNELVSNSLKYAFPDKRQGVIRVSLQEVRDRLQLQVSDDGKGMSDAEEAKLGTSFGYRLIQVFKDQLNAGLTIDRTNGTSVTMAISKYTKIG